MGLEYKLGGPPTAPMALSMGLIPGAKEPPYTMDQIRAKLERLSRDPVQAILVRRDSMALSPQVVTQLESISKDFRARVDSALDPAMEYVMKKGRKIDDQQLNSRLGRAQPQIQRMLADANTHARALLTPAQLRMLPATPMPGGLTPRSAPGGSAGSATSAPDGVRAIKIGGGGD
jgi:cellobiose-specific phosphotransferase system component IIB